MNLRKSWSSVRIGAMYDIVIIGASFAGLTLAHHLPKNLSVLILDMKQSMDQYVESTGLITEKTYSLLKEFLPELDTFIPNKITTIGVVAPDYKKNFFSHTKEPWIYTTDTPAIVKRLSETLPKNVELKILSQFLKYEVKDGEHPVHVHYSSRGAKHTVQAKFIVGADGAISPVARSADLSQNKKFLVGIEKVFMGRIKLGEHPDRTVYHFWFGEFSLGYGGWLSPTLIDGKPAFRLGLAKLKEDAKGLIKVKEFIKILEEKGIIEIDPGSKEVLTFTSMIPIGGALKHVANEHAMLLGDAAGFCGAFAADGIKGAIVSGKVAAELIPRHLDGDRAALGKFHKEIQKYGKLMSYYRKQVFYRFIWNRMKSDRSFHAMFDVIAREKDSFLNQFCDSKDRNKSLVSVVLKWRNIPHLVKYSISLVLDFLHL